MIIRFLNACAIFYLLLTTVIAANCKSNHFALSLEDKADYELAVSRCIGDSDAYRIGVNGEPRTELDISTCQLEEYLQALYNSADGALQSSNIFKALDQNKNGQLSLCDLIFGAEELKKEFYILDSLFSGDDPASKKKREKMETQTDILSLVKVVDDQCDVSCQICPESLCIRKDECAYNVHLGCFQTHQPTLTPTDAISLSEIKTGDPGGPSEVSANVRSNLTWSSNPVQYNSHLGVFTASSARFTELLVGTSTIIWIVLVIYLIRNRKCTCNMCSYRAPCRVERNMDQGLIGLENPGCVGEFSEGGETSGYESTVYNESVCIEGGNVPGFTPMGGSSSTLHRSQSTSNSDILLGGPLILDRLEPATMAVRQSNRNIFAESNQSFEKNKIQANFRYSEVLNGVKLNTGNSPTTTNKDTILEPARFLSVEKCPPVVAISDVEENFRKGQKMRSSSIKRSHVSSVVSPEPIIEKMRHMLGASSSDDSSY